MFVTIFILSSNQVISPVSKVMVDLVEVRFPMAARPILMRPFYSSMRCLASWTVQMSPLAMKEWSTRRQKVKVCRKYTCWYGHARAKPATGSRAFLLLKMEISPAGAHFDDDGISSELDLVDNKVVHLDRQAWRQRSSILLTGQPMLILTSVLVFS